MDSTQADNPSEKSRDIRTIYSRVGGWVHHTQHKMATAINVPHPATAGMKLNAQRTLYRCTVMLPCRQSRHVADIIKQFCAHLSCRKRTKFRLHPTLPLACSVAQTPVRFPSHPVQGEAHAAKAAQWTLLKWTIQNKVKVGAYKSRQKMPRQATLSDRTSDVVSCLLLHAKQIQRSLRNKVILIQVKLEGRHCSSHTTQDGDRHKTFHTWRQQA